MKNLTFWLTFLAIANVLMGGNIAHAQTYTPSNRTPVADSTLGTQVSGNGTNFIITGGLNKGQTLFHSFTDFSVPTNGQANFNNPIGNRDIITRVTGNVFSDINGLVNTNGANFFLINPSGIVFGTNAQLNVGRAFMASTASGINLVDGSGRTFTFGTNGNGDAPLLTVNSNVLFNPSQLIMGASNPGSLGIVNYGTIDTKNDSQYIGLIGGNVILDGRDGAGRITAPGGRVDLGGLNIAGSVTFDNNGLVFGENGLGRSDVSLINGAGATVSANEILGTVDTFFNNAKSPGSSLNVSANNLNIVNDKSTTNISRSFLDAGFNPNTGVKTTPGGDVKIDLIGQLTLNYGAIYNVLPSGAEGNIGNIKIKAKSIGIFNESGIVTPTYGVGKSGNIDITTTGDITIIGTDNQSLLQGNQKALSTISSSTHGKGNTGKITINTTENLLIANRGGIFSSINEKGEGNSQGISITAKDLNLTNISFIETINGGTGNAGNIDIKTTGNLTISGTYNQSVLQANIMTTEPLSGIVSNTDGKGNAGKITINSQGDLSIGNLGAISTNINPKGQGDGQGIIINTKDLTLTNFSIVQSENYGGIGDAGDIDIKTRGDLTIVGTYNQSFLQGNKLQPLSGISSNTAGKGNAGKMTINTKGNLLVANRGTISSALSNNANGSSGGIKIDAGELTIENRSSIQTTTLQTIKETGKGDAGNIDITSKGDLIVLGTDSPSDLKEPNVFSLSRINSSTAGQGDAGKITINSNGRLLIANRGKIFSGVDATGLGKSKDISISAKDLFLANFSGIGTISFGNGSGGNITLNISDKLLMSNFATVNSESSSRDQDANGGNIKITSPLIVALVPSQRRGGNTISANANGGTGGNIKITSQGLFGIQDRPEKSIFNTNSITASSNFGQDGTITIDTPGADPGRDSTDLPNATTDASNQISQVCSASARQNKLIYVGRGGIPENAFEPLNADVVWQDTRAAKSQPTVSQATNKTEQLPPPAVGWVFDGKGKVTLVAAGTPGFPGARIICPK